MDDLFLALFLFSFVGLIIGLIKPSVFNPIIKKEFTRGQVGLFFGGALILFLILFGITSEDTTQPVGTTEEREEVEEPVKTVEDKEKESVEGTKEEVKKEEPEPTPTLTPESTPTTTPAPEPTPEPTPEPEKEEDEATLGEKNALRKATDYLNYTAFSYSGLIDQLEHEGFTHSEAVYGADNSGADWNEQAVLKAQQYMDYTSFSRDGLIAQLEHEGFTRQQAEYGARGVGY